MSIFEKLFSRQRLIASQCLLAIAFVSFGMTSAYADQLDRCGIRQNEVDIATKPITELIPVWEKEAANILSGAREVETEFFNRYPDFDPKMIAAGVQPTIEQFKNARGYEKVSLAGGLGSLAVYLGLPEADLSGVRTLLERLEACSQLSAEDRESVTGQLAQLDLSNLLSSMSDSTSNVVEQYVADKAGDYNSALTQAIHEFKSYLENRRPTSFTMGGAAAFQQCRTSAQSSAALPNVLNDGFSLRAAKTYPYLSQSTLSKAIKLVRDPCAAYLIQAIRDQVSINTSDVNASTVPQLSSVLGMNQLRGSAKISSQEAKALVIEELQLSAPNSVAEVQRLQAALAGQGSELPLVYRGMLDAFNKSNVSGDSILSKLQTAEGLREFSREQNIEASETELLTCAARGDCPEGFYEAVERYLDESAEDALAQGYLGLVGYYVLDERAPGFLTRLGEGQVTLRRIQSALENEETLVFFNETQFMVSSIAITKNDLYAANSRLDVKELRQARDNLRASISAFVSGEVNDAAFDTDAAKLLYDNLLAHLGEAVSPGRRIIIVGNAFAQSIPIDALLLPDHKTFVIDQHEVLITPGFSSFVDQRSRVSRLSQNSLRTIAMLSDPALKSVSAPAQLSSQEILALLSGPGDIIESPCDLARAAATGRIADRLADRFSVAPNGDLRGEGATEMAFSEAAKTSAWRNADVVAFNTHGLLGGEMSARYMGDPALVLSPPGGKCPSPAAESYADDGFLTASEIFSLGLNAKLVLLTACNTAAVSEDIGEPLSGLARAFFANGAQAILVSNWQALVSAGSTDGPTEIFIESLFENFDAGMTLSASVRQAKIATRAHYAHPAAWAVFSIVGD